MSSSLPLEPIPLLASIKLVRGKARIFPYVADILAFQALVAQAWLDRDGTEEAELNEDSETMFSCRHAHMQLRLPLSGFKHAALTGQQPDEIIVRTEPKGPEPFGFHVPGITNISVRLMSTAFAVVAEQMIDWVKEHVTSDLHRFPPVINFGRVIRNAIVHGYRINIRSETAPVVNWRGLDLSHRDFGRQLFDPPLVSGGDFILLMIEMEMELNELNAPFELG